MSEEQFRDKLWEEYLDQRESTHNGVGIIYQQFDDYLIKKLMQYERANEGNKLIDELINKHIKKI